MAIQEACGLARGVLVWVFVFGLEVLECGCRHMGRSLKPQEKHWVTAGERREVEAQSG